MDTKNMNNNSGNDNGHKRVPESEMIVFLSQEMRKKYQIHLSTVQFSCEKCKNHHWIVPVFNGRIPKTGLICAMCAGREALEKIEGEGDSKNA